MSRESPENNDKMVRMAMWLNCVFPTEGQKGTVLGLHQIYGWRGGNCDHDNCLALSRAELASQKRITSYLYSRTTKLLPAKRGNPPPLLHPNKLAKVPQGSLLEHSPDRTYDRAFLRSHSQKNCIRVDMDDTHQIIIFSYLCFESSYTNCFHCAEVL